MGWTNDVDPTTRYKEITFGTREYSIAEGQHCAHAQGDQVKDLSTCIVSESGGPNHYVRCKEITSGTVVF